MLNPTGAVQCSNADHCCDDDDDDGNDGDDADGDDAADADSDDAADDDADDADDEGGSVNMTVECLVHADIKSLELL